MSGLLEGEDLGDDFDSEEEDDVAEEKIRGIKMKLPAGSFVLARKVVSRFRFEEVLAAALQEIEDCRPHAIAIVGSFYGWTINEPLPEWLLSAYPWLRHYSNPELAEVRAHLGRQREEMQLGDGDDGSGGGMGEETGPTPSSFGILRKALQTAIGKKSGGIMAALKRSNGSGSVRKQGGSFGSDQNWPDLENAPKPPQELITTIMSASMQELEMESALGMPNHRPVAERATLRHLSARIRDQIAGPTIEEVRALVKATAGVVRQAASLTADATQNTLDDAMEAETPRPRSSAASQPPAPFLRRRVGSSSPTSSHRQLPGHSAAPLLQISPAKRKSIRNLLRGQEISSRTVTTLPSMADTLTSSKDRDPLASQLDTASGRIAGAMLGGLDVRRS